ncbi:hypothetical protein SAMN05444287_2133 [Octadecabacter temperatus]|uniref:Uncharacterized protein n=1 Tax=Octadecabacter temperatus TaxID=1458307 RepID=A0A0K0Y7R4_9RHOB|nr:DUF1801 domain-containing protein [Octadecabacter temperatus]AKS47008.1 hypothetical protein OSB_24730 [Octadecabacter temperatus]SIO25124.1 hypothetical protein SAMN05444287_2133 [Octadecabacter temperatus]
MTQPFASPAVRDAFAAFPQPAHDTLMSLRAMIYEIGETLPIGRIEESTKWGQPSYATPKTNLATPIRLGLSKAGDPAVFTHCQTTVMSDFRALAPANMAFDGNRAVHLPVHSPPNLNELAPLIRAALTYRL